MKNIILYSVLAGAIVFPAQGTIASERSGKTNSTLGTRARNNLSILDELKRLVENIQTIEESEDSIDNIQDVGELNQAMENIKQAIQEVIDNTRPEDISRLLNEKDEARTSILCTLSKYYERDIDAEEIIDFIKDSFNQTPEGKTYFNLKKAINEKDYDRCEAILKELAGDLEKLSIVLSFADEDNQTLLMQAFDQLVCASDKASAIRIIDIFLRPLSNFPQEEQLNILSIPDIDDINILIRATQTGDMELIKKIKDLFPERNLLDMAMPYNASVNSHIYNNVLEYAVTSGNPDMVFFWCDLVSRLLKEVTTMEHLNDIAESVNDILNKKEASKFKQDLEKVKTEVVRQQKAIEQEANRNKRKLNEEDKNAKKPKLNDEKE